MSNRDKWPKVRAATITIDNQRWSWNVMKGHLAIFKRVDLPDGRISFQLGDGTDMIVQPDDYIRARKQWRGWWNAEMTEFGYYDDNHSWVVIERSDPVTE